MKQSALGCYKRWDSYFNLQSGIRAYLFAPTLENLFLLFKKHPEIKDVDISEHCFLCTAYADDTSFFLKVTQFTGRLIEIFNTFSIFSGSKPHLIKCKIARIGVLKSVQFAVSGLKYIDLRHEAIKILGTYFSCNKTIREESNFLKTFSIVQTVL